VWSVVGQPEPTGGRRLCEHRRLRVERARKHEDDTVAIAHVPDAGEVGRDRGGRVGESGDAMPAHALRNLQHRRELVCGGRRP